jgi:hypothetical protein
MSIDAAGIGDSVAKLTAKVSSIPSQVFEAAADSAGYGTTQQIVLNNLSVTMQTNDFAAYDYWSNICSSVYMYLSPNYKAMWDNANFTQGAVTSGPPVPLFGNTGITGYWSEQASKVGSWISTAVVGDEPNKPDAPGMNWQMILIAVAVLLIVFYMVR